MCDDRGAPIVQDFHPQTGTAPDAMNGAFVGVLMGFVVSFLGSRRWRASADSAIQAGLVLAILCAPGLARAQPAPPIAPGPVAYVGHGAMFDREGNELTPSVELIQRAQDVYLRQLLEGADEGQRQRFRELEEKLGRGLKLDGQSRLVLNSRLIDWLARNVRPEGSERLLGINNVMKLELQRQLPATSSQGRPRSAAPFTMPDELLRRLREAGLGQAGVPGSVRALSTTAGGEAYRTLCRTNGVPVPPDWGTSSWIARGVLTDEFISAGLQAEVFTFQSASPEGMCIALPRFDGDSIRLLGVICLGKASGKACFWDNQSGGAQFFPRRGEVVPFNRFGGGADLVDGVGGICTECHAGENPYIIHPGTALGLPALAGLPLFPDRWHEPLVKPGWPENPGPLSSPGSCAACHADGGTGGRFPELSTLLPGFCGTILPQAIARTMPPGAPGSLAGDPHPIALRAMCADPPRPRVDHWAGAIWRHTGSGCSGESCPGWQRLDNNFRSVAIAAGGARLYQLHNDGAIWRSTGAACSGDSCPGWQRLDNNPRSIAIVAGGDRLYQLHGDGAIWRSTGAPCSGASCPGWERLDNNPATAGLAASGDRLYQLHRDGRIWRFTGTPCSGASCPGWRMLDNNPRTIAIAATGARLFQLHFDGRIWEHTGTACNGASCPGWRMLDNNPRTAGISANDGKLFQRHRDGRIWEFTGTPCSDASCPGWRMLDSNPRSNAISGGVYQTHQDGRIWRGTGTTCSGDSCPGWAMLDNNPRTQSIAAAVDANDRLYQLHAAKLFQLHDNGQVWQSQGGPCSGESCPSWQRLDNNPRTVAISASGGKLCQLHNDGRIWQSTGQACDGDSCPGWRMLDSNPRTRRIASGGGQLYQLHDNGRIWRSTGVACSGASCPGWVMLDNNPRTVEIVAGGGQLYQRHSDGRIWRFTGQACGGESCPGWVMLDNNRATVRIVAAGGRLYQLHGSGRIWVHTGQACSGESCPGWVMLDNNGQTRDIAAGAGELYQRHADGRIWEATGQPCSSASCPGWRMLDNNPRSVALTAADGILYQRHDNGQIWRSDGRACSGATCPGWQRLDNNGRTVAIEAAHE